ncbi:Ig-like domain-containing protein [Paenibacillus sp. strain BS8-2]
MKAGITGVTTSNVSAVVAALQADGTAPWTLSEIQTIVNAVIDDMTTSIPDPILTDLTSNPANVMLTVACETWALAITANFDDDTSLVVTGEAQYASNDTSVATVSAGGIVRAVANGTTNIVVTYDGLTKIVPVIVTASRQLEFIYTSFSSVSLSVGASTNISVFAYFDDESAEDATAWATFEIEDPDLATIDANGYLTALKPGRTKIKEFITDELIIWE